ncbi:sensor domain-containing protein [Dehalococcoides mccartyi]|nr:sensor domain-containing protein [Dehalococcoides mccartyi]
MTYKYNPFAAAYPSDRGPLGKIFQPVYDLRTYLRAGHMLLMFPLGIAYFVFFVTTLSVGGSMIWTLVGPIILLATLFVSRWLGDLEAYTAGYVNGSTIRRPPFRIEGVSGFRSQIKVRLVDPTTWTGIVYLVVQFPLGIAAFVGLIVVYAFAGASLFSPLGVWLVHDGGFWDFAVQVQLFWTWDIDLNSFPGSLIPIPFGVLGLILASHLILAFSSLHGWWARMMLGSRSARVSSRPVPSPADDDPPRPSTSVETATIDVDAVTTIEVGLKPGLPDSYTPAEDKSTEQEPEIESPKTAAHVASGEQLPNTPIGDRQEPFLKVVPNPTDLRSDDDHASAPDFTPIAELTTREQEVFMLMAHGDTNADIAEELFISEGTVKTHVKRVFSKLYMRDRTQVVVFAYERGLVVPGAASAAQMSDIDRRSFGG